MGVDLGLGIWVDKYEVSVKTEDTVRERAFFVRLKITYVLGIRSFHYPRPRLLRGHGVSIKQIRTIYI